LHLGFGVKNFGFRVWVWGLVLRFLVVGVSVMGFGVCTPEAVLVEVRAFVEVPNPKPQTPNPKP
jgi:hypothetical protein